MAHYKIEIEYTSNKDKAGKVIIKDNSDKVIVKSDVILPNWMHEIDGYESELEVHKFIFTDYSKENTSANVKAMSQYYQLLGNYYMKDKPSYKRGDIRIIQKKDFDEGKVLKGTEATINFPMRVFENIKFILLNEENTVSIETTKKRFIWGQKPCERDFDSSHQSHIELGEEIAYREKQIRQKLEAEESRKRIDEMFAPLKNRSDEEIRALYRPQPKVQSSTNKSRQQPTSYVNQDGVKKVRNSNSREYNNHNSNNNPHHHFQQIYQTVAQQTMYESASSHSCRSSDSSSRHESSSNDYSCGSSSSSSPSFD